MLKPGLLVATLTVGCFLSSPVMAQSCGTLARAIGVTPEELIDGATYVKIGPTWRAISSPVELGLAAPQILQGVHVVKDTSGQQRIGALIIKSGQVGPIRTPASRRVALVRSTYNTCNPNKPSVVVSSIQGDVYDGFHDFGRLNYDRNELVKLSHFHVKYGKNCENSTDDDPGGVFRHYSNRSQFSYSEDVVNYGGYTAAQSIVGSIGFGPAAVAGTEPAVGKINRQTELKLYETTVGFACIPVSVPYTDAGSFFRTNDLGATPSLARERRYWTRD